MGIKFDHFPGVIAEVEIESAVSLGEAGEDRTLGTLKVRLALEYANGLLESLVLWSACDLQVITPKEPLAELLTL